MVDWEAARVYTATDTQPNSFQVWIRVGTEEDVTYTYGPVGAGDGGFLTVGAENLFGNRGQSYYYNGTGTAPVRGHRAARREHARRRRARPTRSRSKPSPGGAGSG